MTVILANSSSAGGIAQLITVILIFLFVLLITVFTTKLVGDYQKIQSVNSNMEVIETIRVANGKYLQVVRVGSKYIVIGIGKDEVSMLTEIKEDELISVGSEKSSMKESFADIMSIAGVKFRKGSSKNDNNE